MFNWIEDNDEKRVNFEIDYTIFRYFIKTNFISMGERIRIVKYPNETETILIYYRLIGMNEEYMFRNTFKSKFFTFLYNTLNKILYKKVDIYGEDVIIESKYIKIKPIEDIVKKHFITYIRDIKLNKIFFKY